MNTQLIRNSEVALSEEPQKADRKKTVKTVLEDDVHKVVSIELAEGEVLSRHSSVLPISVLCLKGTGAFLAGDHLEESATLCPGVLLALGANVIHEVRAGSGLHFLLTQFKISDKKDHGRA